MQCGKTSKQDVPWWLLSKGLIAHKMPKDAWHNQLKFSALLDAPTKYEITCLGVVLVRMLLLSDSCLGSKDAGVHLAFHPIPHTIPLVLEGFDCKVFTENINPLLQSVPGARDCMAWINASASATPPARPARVSAAAAGSAVTAEVKTASLATREGICRQASKA